MEAGPHLTAVPGTPRKGGLSVAFLLVASLMIGVGLFSASYYLITFQWVYLAGVLLVVAGGLMLFDPRTGPDRAG